MEVSATSLTNSEIRNKAVLHCHTIELCTLAGLTFYQGKHTNKVLLV